MMIAGPIKVEKVVLEGARSKFGIDHLEAKTLAKAVVADVGPSGAEPMLDRLAVVSGFLQRIGPGVPIVAAPSGHAEKPGIHCQTRLQIIDDHAVVIQPRRLGHKLNCGRPA